MADETGDLTGFQPDHINLTEMNDAVVKSMFIGDGMSGKTQILITFGKLLINYLQQIYSGPTKSYQTEFIGKVADSSSLTPAFHNWATSHGFFLRYGKTEWDFSAVNLDSETIGLEDFEFIFPYVHNKQTYNIKLIGNDVGGQNIFDHFRTVLGKMAGPDDNLIVVFDKSRELSCFNSIEQINKVIGGMKPEARGHFKPDSSRITYCGNKIDLEEHIQTQKWRDGVINSIMNKITKTITDGIGEYSFPSLVGEKKEERVVKFKIENNRITFPDLEILIYNSIRESDEKYGTNIMSEVNTKALCREIAAQLVYDRKTVEYRDQNLQLQKIWEIFKSLLFQDRPLAMQYSVGIKIFQQAEDSTYFGKVRTRWHEFGLPAPISQEIMESALQRSSSAGDLLAELGKCFDTNALSGEGILPMIDSIIQETLSRGIDPSKRQKKRGIIRKLEKF